MPKIIVSDGAGRRREVELLKSLVIGRGPGVDVKLAGLDVSPRHARIWKTRKGYFIHDLRSRHGTFVDGARVKRSPLRDGMRIEIGGRQMVFLLSDAPSPDAPPPVQKGRRAPVRGVREKSPKWHAEDGGAGVDLNVVASRDSLDPMLFVDSSSFRHETEMERLRERLRALREVGQRIASTLSCDALLQQVLDILAKALPQGRHGFIALLNLATNQLEIKKFVTPDGEAGVPPEINRAIADLVMSSHRAVLCDRGPAEAPAAPGAAKPGQAPKPLLPEMTLPGASPEARGTVICAPLVSPGKDGVSAAIGILQWEARPGHKFSQDDLDFLVGSASMAAAAVQTARLCDELREARQLLVMEYRRLHSQQSELEVENVTLRQELKRNFPFEAIVGASSKMKEAVGLAQKVKDSRVSVLITGDSGAGKEMFAKAIHYNSLRALKPFVALNCAAVPETLLESELFGIEKGVATGVESRVGKLEMASGGTIFLDEVGDMAPSMQAKLLRVLQENEFTRVGGHTPVKVDLRVISATNKNLRDSIAKCEFREELYYRLNVIEIHLPSLKERPEDILPLAQYFLRLFSREFGKAVHGFSKDAEELLLAYKWPGNVREMKNVVQRCVVLTEPHGLVDRRLLPPQITGLLGKMPEGGSLGKMEAAQAAIERPMIIEALAAAGGNKSKAALILGISREGLRLKLAKYGLK